MLENIYIWLFENMDDSVCPVVLYDTYPEIWSPQ